MREGKRLFQVDKNYGSINNTIQDIVELSIDDISSNKSFLIVIFTKIQTYIITVNYIDNYI